MTSPGSGGAGGRGPGRGAHRSRVLLVLATSAGGVGRHVAELAAGLSRAGQYGDVLVSGPQPPSAGSAVPGGFAFEAVDIADRPRPLADARAVARLRALCSGRDVVHAHGLRAGALAGLATALVPRGRRPALVVTLHNALVPGGRAAVVHRILELTVARRADVVLAVSADICAALAARGARDVRLAVVPAPDLPPPRRTPAQVRADLGVQPGTALLVTVARLAPQKGLDVLVAAVAALVSSQAPVTAGPGTPILAVIAGEGPLRDRLTSQARAAGAPVRLLGHRDDVADLIAAADVVVMPSRWEGQPLAAQEALRAGAALVATDSGGTGELVGEAGLLVPAGDAAALAEAIGGLLADPAQARELRVRARARAAGLPAAGDALRQVEQVYEQVARGFTRPA